MRRLLTVTAAWLLGAGVYVAAAIGWNGYDGFPDTILLPACGAVVSAAFVGGGLLAGRALRRTPLGRAWQSRSAWAAVAAVGSVAVLVFGSAVGLTGEYTDPDTGEPFRALHPAAALGGYALLLFAVAHWPLGRLTGAPGAVS
ncbi:hypothetical protein GobsT_13410 [Gemmata obscuriglobus]|uniref:Uncharacterized protein n=1 Tax=Gemmata obscuriglobus TaxID=114 RepID=A0A2Z3H761_9BACT|nr:hypothetical protein [Gemmata obscuriglobus]AWM40212.1 hypothetical protein C1280_26545 [Gemmata obscuriglobus]QEG26598.1 hypothetical protein GobsT_13410 [Gemmata obscuriglobus]VTS02083.1 unnamed protein product [Gemmata obscuriglobus UQM 2246]